MPAEPSVALGATPGPDGTTFAVTSSVAERIEVCLFDVDGHEADHVDLAPHDGTWSATVAGVGPGTRYGYRVHGPGDPARGHACDPAKLLIDPAARRVAGELTWTPELVAPGVDSAPFVPRSVVVAPPNEPVGRLADPRPWDEVVAYEAHVGHLTARHRLVRREQRGRYAGLGHPAVLDHLRRLGVNAVELLPVQHFVSEEQLVADGRRNVWGYNPLAWGAPHAGYASAGGDPVAELRAAIAAVHEAGLEVWLDVVFNHTCEGSLGSGPILSWRGFDNADAYRLRAAPDGTLVDDDVTGCGNSIDASSPTVRRLIREALARWVTEFGIDGFRFDLAATLLRADDGPQPDAPLLAELAADERLAGVRLVAEPWDTGLGGYAVGGFPPPWREWNDRYRDDVRDLWRGEPVGWSTVATRLVGSADLYGGHRADPTVGVGAIATHDGFTLADLVTYDHPTDGAHGQRSDGAGRDGPTTDPEVVARRRQRQRALLGTMLCSRGVPMINAGDELGRTQGGRADGYTLDPSRWGLPWPEADWDLVAWTATAVDLRRRHQALRHARWVEPGDPTITWLTPAGVPFGDDDWNGASPPGLCALLASPGPDDATVLVLLAPTEAVDFTLPEGRWYRALDAAVARNVAPGEAPVTGSLHLGAGGFVVLVDQH
ncbi:MAG: hypothetical protein KDA98_06450 [Acidimicrobiales bacterium]|nr:hypothetical protein [Acidimicrobiales bacterium]